MKLPQAAFGAISVPALLAIAAVSSADAQHANSIFKAELSALNSNVTGLDAVGKATFAISGDELTIHVTAQGVPPSIVHLQHFHGFSEGEMDARCPTTADDANGDGIIDLIETEPLAGTTMVPFHDDPVGMEIVRDTYPSAGADAAYSYEIKVSLAVLQDSFASKFEGQQLDLDRRVVFLHGVPESTDLPASVASLGDIPAQVTLPIACGEIAKAGD
jgi:hypothetical protein